jgi:hypothetical protein
MSAFERRRPSLDRSCINLTTDVVKLKTSCTDMLFDQHSWPKVPEAKIRGSLEGVSVGYTSLERVPGVLKGVQRGPMGYPPGPLQLAALGVH